jgi:hypothetical protein
MKFLLVSQFYRPANNHRSKFSKTKKTGPYEKAGPVLNGLLNGLFVTDGKCYTAICALHVGGRNLKFNGEIAAFLGNKIIEFNTFVRLVREQQIMVCVVNSEFHYVRESLTKVQNSVTFL